MSLKKKLLRCEFVLYEDFPRYWTSFETPVLYSQNLTVPLKFARSIAERENVEVRSAITARSRVRFSVKGRLKNTALNTRDEDKICQNFNNFGHYHLSRFRFA
jgi:hypothetical protein